MTSTKGLRRIGGDEQIIFDRLVRDIADAEFLANYPSGGEFFTQSHDGREYWYYRGLTTELAHCDGDGGPRYVGPCGDTEIDMRVGRAERRRVDISRMRNGAETLRQSGWTSPTHMEGRVLRALSEAGVFRLRSVLVGSVAYQAYPGLLGLRLPCASLRTDDVDLALDFGISNTIGEFCDDIPAALRRADPSLAPRPHLNDHALMATFQSSSGFQVEFLTTHRGSDEHTGRLSRLPSLGPHMAGVPLRYLDFLIKHPVRSIVLFEAGIGVTVPAPERFAVHKLIVAASRRAGNPKILKDLAQASELINAHAEKGWIGKLELAWVEAWARGGSWRAKLAMSLKKLDKKTQMFLPH